MCGLLLGPFSSQAAVYYYRTLFYVYHGFEAGTSDLEILQRRMRTLSAELPILFGKSERRDSRCTLRGLNLFLEKARYDPGFFIDRKALEGYCDRVTQFRGVATRLCERRIALYEARAE